MASQNGNRNPDLASQLQREPWRFSFVQAVRLLRQINRQLGFPVPSPGGDAHPDEEPVRFDGCPTRTFPATEVLAVRPVPPDDPDRPGAPRYSLSVSFMGLYGPCGVLPQHDTQRIIDHLPRTAGSDRPRSHPEKDLLDLFTHRVISLFWRACTRYRVPFSYEESYADPSSGPGLFTRTLWSIAGLGLSGTRGRLVPPDEAAIEFSGFLGHYPRNAVSLQRMLSSWLAVPVEVREFCGQWMQLPEDMRSSMPTRRSPLGSNCALGRSFIVGARIWDAQGKFRLRVGPLSRREFQEFLPPSPRLISLGQLARLYAGVQFDFDVQLELRAADVPFCGLAGTARLGQNSWLISRPPAENRIDTVLRVDGAPCSHGAEATR